MKNKMKSFEEVVNEQHDPRPFYREKLTDDDLPMFPMGDGSKYSNEYLSKLVILLYKKIKYLETKNGIND